MPAPKTDNIDIKRAVALDDRTGKIAAGSWTFFTDIADANTKTSIQNYKCLGLTIPIASNGIVVEFWLRDNLTDWRRKTQFVGTFTTLAALQTAFNGTNATTEAATTPETGLWALVNNTVGTPMKKYTYDGTNAVWAAESVAIATDLTTNDDTHIPSVKAVNTALSTTLALTNAQKSALTPGVTYLAAILKDPVTSVTAIDPSIQSIDFFSPLDDATLSAETGWGNVTGKNSEYKKFTGDNRNGALGRSAQTKVVAGNAYTCVQHSLGTTATDGYAIYSRNRAVNFLDANNTDDALIIAQLVINSNFDSATQLANLSLNSTPGMLYTSPSGGYLYICIAPNIWSRVGFSTNYKPMAINTGTHPFLTAHLTAHVWSGGAYVQGSDTTNGIDETSYQDQKYYTTGYVYIKTDNNNWVRLPLNT